MQRTIFCQKLKKELPGLEKPPIPGPLGTKIYEQISEEAWKLWLGQQIILINENRLRLVDPKAREFLLTALENFLFETAEKQ